MFRFFPFFYNLYIVLWIYSDTVVFFPFFYNLYIVLWIYCIFCFSFYYSSKIILQINNDLLILNKHINESIYLLNLIDWFNFFNII